MTWLYVGTWRVFWTRRREVKPDLFRTPTRFCLCDPISRINVWHACLCKPTECYVSLGSWCSVHVQENITSLALNTLVTTETAVNVSRCFCCSLVGCNDELRRHGGNFFSRLMDFVSTFSLFGLQLHFSSPVCPLTAGDDIGVRPFHITTIIILPYEV